MTSYALAHDFFVTEGGAEQCAIEFAQMLPAAPVYTSFFDIARFGDRILAERVRAWPLQRLVGSPAAFRSFYPLYAAYFGALRADADVLLTSSIAFTKAMRTRAGGIHISYVYTPMRYAWDLDTYLSESSYSRPARLAARAIRPFMQWWDRHTAQRPNRVVAISNTVRRRIEENWRRGVDEVVYPPVRVDEIELGTEDEGYYLVAARLLAYRRIDLAVQTFSALGRELVIIGDGPERPKLQALAGPSVRFVGYLPRDEVVRMFRRCRGYVVPGVEDFGIAPVEAMAAGKPVIAFRGGGATETVDEGRTGIFFDEPSVGSLRAAIQTLETMRFEPAVLRQHAQSFSADVFRRRWQAILQNPASLGS